MKIKQVLGKVRKICDQFNLIEDGDKIAVGVSGGKDSLVLLQALSEYKKFNGVNFDLIAITIDQTNGETDFEPVKNFCRKLNV